MDLSLGTIAVLNRRGDVVGAGFLASPAGLVATCAHVIQVAEGGPNEIVTVRFLQGSQTCTAKVLPESWRDETNGDIAILQLQEPVPAGVEPLSLGASDGTTRHEVTTLGFPNLRQIRYAPALGVVAGAGDEAGRRLLTVEAQGITTGYSGAPVWDERRRRVIGMVVMVARTDALGKLPQTAFSAPSEALQSACAALRPSDLCPYRNLRAFNEEDAEYFFGRNDAVGDLVTKLQQNNRFLAVLGPSGSGKSSLVRAGLVARLRAGALPGSEKWGTIVARPTTDPFADLQEHGLPNNGADLLSALKDWHSNHADNPRLVLVIDQFEELFVSVEDHDKREKFVNALLALLKDPRPVTVVIVMRDDFYPRFLEEAAVLSEWLERGLKNVSLRLSKADLTAIIREPALRTGWQFDPPNLVDTLVKQAIAAIPYSKDDENAANSSVLPLLEFTLDTLWSQRKNGSLQSGALETMGGVTGSLTQWATDAFQSLESREELSQPEQQMVASVLVDLVYVVDESQALKDSRRRRKIDEVCKRYPNPEKAKNWITQLATDRLLITSSDMVELVHDALLFRWDLMRQWLKSNRRFKLWQQEVERRLQTWKDSAVVIDKRDPKELLKDRDLSRATEWLTAPGIFLSKEEKEFVQASMDLKHELETQERDRQRRELDAARDLALAQKQRADDQAAAATRQRKLTLVLIGVSLIAAVIAGFWRHQKSTAERETRIAQAQALAAHANEVRPKYPVRSALLAVEALRSTSLNEIQAPVHQALRDSLGAIGGRALLGTNGAECMAFSPDCKWFATGNADGTTWLWPIGNGGASSHPTVLGKRDRAIRALAFSPDGRWLATAGDWRVALWNLLDTNFVTPHILPSGHQLPIILIAFSPNGRWLATGSDGVQLWEFKDNPLLTTNCILLPGPEDVSLLVFSPDSRWLASSTLAAHDAYLWNLEETEPQNHTRVLNGPNNPLRTIVFSPDSQKLVAGVSDGTASVWPLKGGRWAEEALVLAKHEDQVVSAAFATNGLLATASWDETVRLWQFESEEADSDSEKHKPLSPVIRGHTGRVWSVAFSHDRRLMATASDDQTVRIWYVQDLIAALNVGLLPDVSSDTLPGPESGAISAEFSPDDRWLAARMSDKSVRLWDLQANTPTAGSLVLRVQGDSEDTTSLRNDGFQKLAFSPDSRWVGALGFSGGLVCVWEVKGGRPVGSPNILRWEDLEDFSFSNDGRWLAARSDRAVVLWNFQDEGWPEEPSVLVEHTNVTAVVFSNDGARLAAAGDVGVLIWDLKDGATSDPKVLRHERAVTTVSFSPNGRRLVTGSSDHFARLWDLNADAKQAEPAVLRGHSGSISATAFSHDGRWIATGSEDGTAMVWDVTANDPSSSALVFKGHTNPVTVVAFSHDDTWLATACPERLEHDNHENAVRLWNLRTKNRSPLLLRSQEQVRALAFSREGNWLATVSYDREVCLWDIRNLDARFGKVLLRGHRDRVTGVDFSYDDRWLGTVSLDGTLRLWPVRFEDMVEDARKSVGRNLSEDEWDQYLPGKSYVPTFPEIEMQK